MIYSTIACTVVGFAILAFIFWQLYRSNMEIPEGAEKKLSPRDELRFRLDHDLPIK